MKRIFSFLPHIYTLIRILINYFLLQPGMFIKFFNLHCPKHKIPDLVCVSSHDELELVLHQGSSYGRGMKILSETDPEIDNLKKRLEDLTKKAEETHSSVKPGPKDSHSKSVKRNNVGTGKELLHLGS